MVVLTRKIAVMGYPCVGKSSITLRFVKGTFPDAYDTTVEDMYNKNYKYQNRDYILRITDTAGQQEYSLFPRSCSFDIDGFILVYAIDDRRSFEVMQTIYDKIRDNVGDMRIPLVLVGNKSDLQYNSRSVTKEEGQSLAAQWQAHFLETSAKDNNAIQQIFEKVLFEIEVSKGNIVRPRANDGGKCVIA
ncbi:unnamed protein product, partial [Mesorhabditis belari]|uniref:GTP-binding protein Rheb n=1 Tax=Mesorhabditis belari TaxID=2138241 RepID=A0AAF3FIF2_9BILA